MATENISFLKGGSSSVVSTTYTLSIEFFRIFFHVALLLMFVGGKLLSDLYVFAPENPGDLVLGIFTPTGTRKITDTVIYSIFGFNHSCNLVDFNPAKEYAALAIPFVTLPMVIFLLLSFFRAQVSHLNGVISDNFYTFVKWNKPFIIYVMAVLHMWFVNSPQDSDGYGFIGHYLPYAMFQIGIALVAIEQCWYYIELNNLPFGLKRGVMIGYVIFLCVLTLVCQLLVWTIIVGTPILDSKNNLDDRAAFEFIGNLYAFCVLIVPLPISWVEFRSGDNNSVTFGVQGITNAPLFTKND